MAHSGIDRFLSSLRRDGTAPLAPEFAVTALAQARHLKRLVILHRRALMAASIVAVGLSFLISSLIGRSVPQAPPASEAFRARGFAVPPHQP